MNPYFSMILWAVGILFLFIFLIMHNNRSRKKLMLKKIRRVYGNVPEREYETGDIEKISHYFRRKCGEQFAVDDITWNDLDMDRIYMLVNQTMSSPGRMSCIL